MPWPDSAPARRRAQAVARRVLGPAHPRALVRWRRVQARHRARRVAALTRRFAAWHGLVVSGGPFAGLVYPDLEAGTLIPKLLGIYERELHDAVEAAIRADPDVILNVGAADGYYAVGLARRCPSAAVHAFDLDPRQRDLCRRVATANGVGTRVRVEDAVGLEGLAGVSGRRPLVVMDCESCEAALLRPGEAPFLRTATIIVELHDFLMPGVGEAVVARFTDTHDVDVRPTGTQPPARASGVALALSEYRPGPMRWAVMIPRMG